MVSENGTRRRFVKGLAAGATGLAVGRLSTGRSSAESVVIGETGSVSAGQSQADEWHSVSLNGMYSAPVVIVKPASFNGPHPCHVRLRNVTPDGFEYRLEEWNYLDGAHATEELHYIAMDEGLYSVGSPALKVEVGRLSADTTAREVTFSSFDTRPVLLAQSQTFHGQRDAIVARPDVVNEAQASVRLQEQESRPEYHETEAVGYIAFETGAGRLPGLTDTFEVGLSGDTVTHDWTAVEFTQSYDSDPLFLADMQTYEGPDPTGLRHQNLDGDGAEVKAEEERSADDEVNHTTEEVGYVVFNNGGNIYI